VRKNRKGGEKKASPLSSGPAFLTELLYSLYIRMAKDSDRPPTRERKACSDEKKKKENQSPKLRPKRFRGGGPDAEFLSEPPPRPEPSLTRKKGLRTRKSSFGFRPS